MPTTDNKNIALLIDAENISSKYVEYIIDEANKYGKINYRRVFGDWTTNNLKKWKEKMNEFALTPVQQYAYTSGKNVSDFTLIIDAMDILYSRKVNSFCLVTSDSDFTKLVTRLREDNMFVFGMGESKTPISLVNACEAFGYLDKMLADDKAENEKSEKTPPKKVSQSSPSKDTPTKKDAVKSSITSINRIEEELKNIIETNQEDDGWAYWSIVADLLQKKFPGFHPRNYGKNIKPLTFFKQNKKLSVKIDNKVAYIKNKE
jgi:uncharacterized LabA/DUF88 family protein